MKRFLKEYFTFNRREQRGIIVLLVIIILLIICLTILKRIPPSQQYDFTAFEKEIAELEKEKIIDTTYKENISYFQENDIATKKEPEKFYFNPNNLPEQEWKKLGLSDRQIKTIKNYENKGGKFYKKEDLKKMYGISEKLYLSLEGYIQIPPPTSYIKSPKPETVNPKIELNTADSSQLVKLKGIGPSFARRIINYRNKLGGFIKKEQLMEVYGLDSSVYNTVVDQINIDPEKIQQINMNEATINQLKAHPYIKYKTADLIINYKNKHGLYKSVSDIKNIDAIADSVFLRIQPYLSAK